MSTLKPLRKKISGTYASPFGSQRTEHTRAEELAKRMLDLCVALAGSVIFIVPLLIIAVCIKMTSGGPVLYWSDRVGRNNTIFSMPKLRTMQVGTPAVATHLLQNPCQSITRIGGFLRKTSLDELPQLWCILRGDMSVVGPRPALYNQHELIRLRTEKGVHLIRPGLTGWAQINGRDELPIPEKVELDAHYLLHRSFSLDLKIIFMTFVSVVRRDGISH